MLFLLKISVRPLLGLMLVAHGSPAQLPTDNPVASHYGSDAGYPAWTDQVAWHRVLDMSAYGQPGQTDFEKFEAARDELHAQGGGVLYYPAGVYDFSNAPMDGPDGRGLMLKNGIIIRGEAPADDHDATDGTLSLPTRFDFGFTQRTGTGATPNGETPRDWNLVGLQPDTANAEKLSGVDNVGIVWIHMVGASVFWGFELDWSGAVPYSSSGGWKSALVKPTWANRIANGQFPLDYFVGSGSNLSYVGAGSGRLVFGCVLQDSAPVNNVYQEGRTLSYSFGPEGYFMQKFAGRIQVYGSDIFIANNLLPKSQRGFLYQQTVGDNPSQSTNVATWNNITATVYYDYNYTTGIDVNKELLNPFLNNTPGYFEPRVIIRDNFVYNHGRKGFNASGKWVTLLDNTNQRDYLGLTVPANSGPASGQSYYLTLDGYVQAKPGGSGTISDTLSRAFDLAGGPLWIHGSRYGGVWGSTHSIGNDGEGILCQGHGGTWIHSWAVTHNTGLDGYMAGYAVQHSGSLFGWNQTVGKTGSLQSGEMYDSAIVNNTGGTTSTTSSYPVLTSNPGDPVVPPGNVAAAVVDDHVAISWTDGDGLEAGFRVERSVAGGPWTVIAYRPRQEQKHSENPPAWQDGSAPRGLPLRYRVRPLNWGDDGSVVSEATVAVEISALSPLPVDPESLALSDPSWESRYKARVEQMVRGKVWNVGSGLSDADAGKRDWPALLAELWKVRDNDTAVQNLLDTKGATLITSGRSFNGTYYSGGAGSFYKPFSVPGYNMYYFTFKDFSPGAGLTDTQEANARNFEKWDFLAREDSRMDPIYTETEFNSENFNWMARLGGLQWAFELPEHDLGNYQYNWQAGQPKGTTREYFPAYLNNWVRAFFNAGRVEWNSYIYWGFTLQPVLTLYDYPPVDPEDAAFQASVKSKARAGADWMVLEAALHYLDGFSSGPDARAKNKPHEAFTGSIWPYAYAWFADEGHMPTYDMATMESKVPVQNIGWLPWTTYRPLRVMTAIAQRQFTLPVEIQSAKPFYHLDENNYASWAGDGDYASWKADKAGAEQGHRTGFRYEFETLYLDHNYILASLATYRPNGSLGTFSEHNLFRLVVQGTDSGAIQVMGNTGFRSTPAGRDPYEQIGQYGNVMMRLLRNPTSSYNKIWFGIPNVATRIVQNNCLYADMGHGVYFALMPLGTPSMATGNYDTTHSKYTWSYAANALGSVVMEVGTEQEHGSFEAFQAAVTARRPQLVGENRVEYISSAGRNLTLEWTGIATDYPMTEYGGYTLTKAGIIPRCWQDGLEVDYQKWNAYEVVRGERIVHQQWGSGRLSMQAGGEGVEIVVDPDTAEVQYFQIASITPPAHPAGSYAAWRAGYFSEAQILAGEGDPTRDTEGDGLNNLLEYALSLNPWANDAYRTGVITRLLRESDTDVLSVIFRANTNASQISFGLETQRGINGLWQTEQPFVKRLIGTDKDGTPLLEFQIPVTTDPLLARIRIGS